jgi:hypothetical protein
VKIVIVIACIALAVVGGFVGWWLNHDDFD